MIYEKKHIMGNIRTFMPAVALLMFSLSIRAEEFTVSCYIKGLTDGTKIIVYPLSHSPSTPLYEGELTNGMYTFSGIVNEPTCVFIQPKCSHSHIPIILSNEKIKIDANAVDNGESCEITDFVVSGSQYTDKLLSLLSVRDTLDSIRGIFLENYGDLQSQVAKARVDNDTLALNKLMATDEYNEMQESDLSFLNLVSQKYDSLFIANRNTFWGPLLMIALTTYLTPDMRITFEKMSDSAQSSLYGKMIAAELFPIGKPGSIAPDFVVKDTLGNSYSLETLLKGNKYVLIDFWASWCIPCRKELQNIKKLFEAFSEKGFNVVSISIDKDDTAWRRAMAEEQMQWPSFLSPEVANIYKVRAVPTLLLLDKAGKIIAEGDDARGDNLANTLSVLFEE